MIDNKIYFFEDTKENKIYFYDLESRQVILVKKKVTKKNVDSILIGACSYLLSIIGNYLIFDMKFNAIIILIMIVSVSMILGILCEKRWFDKKIKENIMRQSQIVILKNMDINNKILLRTREQRKWLINCFICLILMLIIISIVFFNNLVMLLGLGLTAFFFGMLIYSTLRYQKNTKRILNIVNE